MRQTRGSKMAADKGQEVNIELYYFAPLCYEMR